MHKQNAFMHLCIYITTYLFRYKESCNPGYDYEKGKYASNEGSNTGHFTQLVWKDSRELGMGSHTIEKNNDKCTYIVARYRPAGNYAGLYDINVKRGSFTNTNNCSNLEWMKPKQRNHINIKPGSDLINTFVVELIKGGNINDLNAIDGISTSNTDILAEHNTVNTTGNNNSNINNEYGNNTVAENFKIDQADTRSLNPNTNSNNSNDNGTSPLKKGGDKMDQKMSSDSDVQKKTGVVESDDKSPEHIFEDKTDEEINVNAKQEPKEKMTNLNESVSNDILSDILLANFKIANQSKNISFDYGSNKDDGVHVEGVNRGGGIMNNDNLAGEGGINGGNGGGNGGDGDFGGGLLKPSDNKLPPEIDVKISPKGDNGGGNPGGGNPGGGNPGGGNPGGGNPGGGNPGGGNPGGGNPGGGNLGGGNPGGGNPGGGNPGGGNPGGGNPEGGNPGGGYPGGGRLGGLDSVGGKTESGDFGNRKPVANTTVTIQAPSTGTLAAVSVPPLRPNNPGEALTIAATLSPIEKAIVHAAGEGAKAASIAYISGAKAGLREGLKYAKQKKEKEKEKEKEMLDQDIPESCLDVCEAGLRAHNKFRSIHGVPNLMLDVELCRQAEEYAQKLAKLGRLKPSGEVEYGENLAYGCYSEQNMELTPADAVKSW